MKPQVQHIITSAIMLGLFALIGTTVVAGLEALTAEKIAANIAATRLKILNAVMPADLYDNAILDDYIIVNDEALDTDGKPVTIYRARKQGEPMGAVFETVAPKGYSGPIYLLVGVHLDGTLGGVRILSHKETPGLGDAIHQEHSDWIFGFTGKSLGNPPLNRWGVKRDGGEFDQFTGATISPRLVVRAVRDSLLYYQAHQKEIYATSPSPQPPS
jgi:electron transport complex protein RnfG